MNLFGTHGAGLWEGRLAKMLETPVLGLAALMAWHTDPHKSNRASVSRVCEFRTAVGGRGVLEAALETLQEGSGLLRDTDSAT